MARGAEAMSDHPQTETFDLSGDERHAASFALDMAIWHHVDDLCSALKALRKFDSAAGKRATDDVIDSIAKLVAESDSDGD
jgi:hypothetical protein